MHPALKYGQKSEKTEIVLENAEQLSFFDEAESEADVSPKAVQTTDVKAHKRVKRTQDEIFGDLPVEEVLHPVEDKTCDKCGGEMVVIGKEKIRDELIYVPAHLFLRRHVAEVAKCTSCGMDEERDTTLMPDIEACNISPHETATTRKGFSGTTADTLYVTDLTARVAPSFS